MGERDTVFQPVILGTCRHVYHHHHPYITTTTTTLASKWDFSGAAFVMPAGDAGTEMEDLLPPNLKVGALRYHQSKCSLVRMKFF